MHIDFKTLKVALAGAFIGLANLVPGLSGGTIAVVAGVYEDLVAALKFDRDFFRKLSFLIPLLLGAGLSVLFFARIIEYTMSQYLAQMQLLFVGLILGTVPSIYRRMTAFKLRWYHLVAVILAFSVPVALRFVQPDNGLHLASLTLAAVPVIFLSGFASSSTMVVPGVSGSMILMVMGTYGTMISALNNFAISIIFVFGLGMLVGVIAFSRLIHYLLNRCPSLIYLLIIGLLLGSAINVWPGLAVGGLIVRDAVILMIGFLLVYLSSNLSHSK